MPRPLTVRVKPYPELQEHRFYHMQVRDVVPPKEGKSNPDENNGFVIVFENREPDQQGRIRSWILPLSFFPGDPAADFFRACGIEPAPGAKIDPRAAMGKVLGVRFDRSADGKDFVISGFKAIDSEITDNTRNTREASGEAEPPPASQKPQPTEGDR